MNDQNINPFQFGWLSFGLGEYRPCKYTYQFYSYNNLPPIDETQFKGDLQWLVPLNADLDASMQIYRPSEEERERTQENLQNIIKQAKDLDLSLPDEFIQFMSSPELQDHIPSCTACYFELAKKIVPCPGTKDGYVIRFLNDQQGVLTWYLYLTPKGEQSVLVTGYWLDELEDATRVNTEDIFICSLSFEAFIHRFWLENIIWYDLNDKKPLTETERHYIEHYTHNKE